MLVILISCSIEKSNHNPSISDIEFLRFGNWSHINAICVALTYNLHLAAMGHSYAVLLILVLYPCILGLLLMELFSSRPFMGTQITRHYI